MTAYELGSENSALESGKILIPQIEIVPTNITANSSTPPELEIRFDMDPLIPDFQDISAPLPVNWQLRFLHNQLFRYFKFPARFCPGPFHSTFVRKVQFRSRQHEEEYFRKCSDVVASWRDDGPKPLSHAGWNVHEKTHQHSDKHGYDSGIYLFSDRQNIAHYFKPNFLPPYNHPEKREKILHFLREEWDSDALEWRSLVPTSNRVDSKETTRGDNVTHHHSAYDVQNEMSSPSKSPRIQDKKNLRAKETNNGPTSDHHNGDSGPTRGEKETKAKASRERNSSRLDTASETNENERSATKIRNSHRLGKP